MKTLTLTQPWASLVAIEAQRIETRSWSTGYRGPLAIHAAKSFPREAANLCAGTLFRATLQSAFGPDFYPTDLPTGAIIAITGLVDCVLMTPEWIATVGEPERSFGDYQPGRYAWLLGQIERLEPIPARGSLGLWWWDKSMEESTKDADHVALLGILKALPCQIMLSGYLPPRRYLGRPRPLPGPPSCQSGPTLPA